MVHQVVGKIFGLEGVSTPGAGWRWNMTCLASSWTGWGPARYIWSCHFNKRRKLKRRKLKNSQIYDGVGVIVFIIKLSELESDRSQDDDVCSRRLLIFLDQGNISKLPRRPQTCFWTWLDSQRTLCIIQVWTKLKSSNCDKTQKLKL